MPDLMGQPCPQVNRLADLSSAVLLLSLVLSIVLAGCGTPPLTIPVSVLVRAAKEGRGSDCPVDPRALEREVAETLGAALVFSDVAAANDSRPGHLRPSPDYLLELEVLGTSFGVESSEATGRAFLSTVAWFLLVVPAWWIDDRIYPRSDVQVRARFLPAGAGRTGRPLLSQLFRTDDLTLDLWRRGATEHFFLSLLLPPFWMEDREAAERALAQAVLDRVRFGLPGRVRKEWLEAAFRGEPGCFLVLDPPGAVVDVWEGRADLRGWLAARSPLEELRVLEEGGKVLKRLDRAALARLSVPDRAALEAHLGSDAPPLGTVYDLALERLEVGGSRWIRIEARRTPEAVPADFTVLCAERTPVKRRVGLKSPASAGRKNDGGRRT